MEGVLPGIVERDFNEFPQQDPRIAAAARKEREKKERQRPKRAVKQPTATQINAAEKLAEQMNEKTAQEKELSQRAALARRARKYYLHFADKISVKAPKNISARMSLEQLTDLVKSIEADLGMSGGIEAAAMMYAEGLAGLETVTMDIGINPLGLNLRNLGQVVQHPSAREEWSPLITEFVIKHENWFSFSVEARLLRFTGMLLLKVHRVNTTAAAMYGKKGKTEVDDELRAKAEDL
jgi:hypothetical protein